MSKICTKGTIMLSKITIFDFDLTVTKEHTFEEASIEELHEAGFTEFKSIYDIGLEDAADNIKQDFPALQHHAKNLSVIATYHNNPHYIAGFMAYRLGVDLDYVETRTSGVPVTAINIYKVEGSELPFFISYIPDFYDEFNKKIAAFGTNGKNPQIQFLRQTLEALGYATPETMVDFYDDSRTNFIAAQKLAFTNCYHVDGKNKNFRVIATKLATPKPEVSTETVLDSRWGVLDLGEQILDVDAESSAPMQMEVTPSTGPSSISLSEFVQSSPQAFWSSVEDTKDTASTMDFEEAARALGRFNY